MIYNLGSINADYFYEVPHLPKPGETLAATALSKGLGGKGANMSVAAARAGSDVVHIGTVGQDGHWAVDRMKTFGVNTDHIAVDDTPTGHAIINLDTSGENAIVIYPGANVQQSEARIEAALSEAGMGDLLMLQNETNMQSTAARFARSKNMRVLYAAAPFDVEAVRAVKGDIDILVLNKIEYQQLVDAFGHGPEHLGPDTVIVTRGADGGTIYGRSAGFKPHDFASPKVQAVDTTGAGDTFTGFFAAGLDQGLDLRAVVNRAARAAALKVTKKGTADAIPSLEDVERFAF